MVDPSEDEIKEVCQNVNIKEDFIRYALDNEEKARIDVEDEDDTILFIIDIPVTEKLSTGGYMYATMPIGMIVVRDDELLKSSQMYAYKHKKGPGIRAAFTIRKKLGLSTPDYDIELKGYYNYKFVLRELMNYACRFIGRHPSLWFIIQLLDRKKNQQECDRYHLP